MQEAETFTGYHVREVCTEVRQVPSFKALESKVTVRLSDI